MENECRICKIAGKGYYCHGAEKAKPVLVKATVAFNRKTLRKTILSLFDNDVFQLTSKILDRDTLIVTVLISHYTKQSMQAIVGMYLREFLDVDGPELEDWFPKSAIEAKSKAKS